MLSEPHLPSVRQGRKVVPLDTNDRAIAAGLSSGEPWAADALYEKYAGAILRMLRRTLGQERHADFEDLVHEVFVQALTSVGTLKDSAALLAWLQTIAARVAFRTMRRRRARRWLLFERPEDLPEATSLDSPWEARLTCAAFYRVLERMPASEQIVFSLRYVEGQELTQVAQTIEKSLSTTKRHLAKAEARFVKLSEREPHLKSRLAESKRWGK